MPDTPSVMFACVHNAGRSQMAAGWLRHLAGDRVRVLSGGSTPAAHINPAAVEAMREVDIDLTGQQPRPWTEDTLAAADVVVTMGCGDACPVIPGNRCLDWELEDPAGGRPRSGARGHAGRPTPTLVPPSRRGPRRVPAASAAGAPGGGEEQQPTEQPQWAPHDSRWMLHGPGDDHVDARWAPLALRALLEGQPSRQGRVHLDIDGVEVTITGSAGQRRVTPGHRGQPDATVAAPLPVVLAIAANATPLEDSGAAVSGHTAVARELLTSRGGGPPPTTTVRSLC